MDEHLLVFSEREVADAVADGLDRHVYSVRVLRETLAGEDDADDPQWLVHVVDERALPVAEVRAERTRFTDLARDNGGWYDDTELTELTELTEEDEGDEGDEVVDGGPGGPDDDGGSVRRPPVGG